MASKAAAIGDVVTAWLNEPARTWPLTGWVAVRTWAPDAELVDLTKETSGANVPRVEVVPDSADPEEPMTRAAEELTWTVYVVIRQKYAGTGAVPTDWVDGLAEIAEVMADRLRDLEVDGVGFKCVCEATKLETLVDPVELRERRTAVSVIAAIFREYRTAA